MTDAELMAERICSVDDCERRHYAKGYCRMHYKRWRNHGTTEKPRHHMKGEFSRDCPERNSWGHMRQRCKNPRSRFYADYGGRGISVCERWDRSFDDFYRDMGPKPSPQHSLDRIDNSGNYEPGNCRWATAREQNNNRRDNVLIEAFGESHTAPEWSRRTGIKRTTIECRLKSGMTAEQALLTPVREQKTNAVG